MDHSTVCMAIFGANPMCSIFINPWRICASSGAAASELLAASVVYNMPMVEKTRLCINFDLGGTIAGHEFATVTGRIRWPIISI